MPTDIEAELSDALDAYAAAVVPHAEPAPAAPVVPLRPRPRRAVVLAVAAAVLAAVGAVALLSRGDGSRVEIQPAEFRPTPPYPDLTARRVSGWPPQFKYREEIKNLYYLQGERGPRLFAYDETGRREQTCAEFEVPKSGGDVHGFCTYPGADMLEAPEHKPLDARTVALPGFANADARAVAIVDEAGARLAVVPAVRVPGLVSRVYLVVLDASAVPARFTIVSLDADGNEIERTPNRPV